LTVLYLPCCTFVLYFTSQASSNMSTEYAKTPRPSTDSREKKSTTTAKTTTKCDCSCKTEVVRLKSEVKRIGEQRIAFQTKCTLLEERARRDAKRIQSLEVLSKQDPKLKNTSEEKYLKDIDELSSKIYKLEERNQSLMEEMNSLKTELRNRKKDFDHSMKAMQVQHERNTKTLTQNHKEFADNFKKDYKKEIEELHHRLAVQESDLHKKYQRHVQEIKLEATEREHRLKEQIRKLQDALHVIKVTQRRESLKSGEKDLLYDDLLDDSLLNDDINESPAFAKSLQEPTITTAEIESNNGPEDLDECY